MAPSVLAQAKQATAEAEASSVMMRQNLQVETKLEVLSYGDTLPGIPKFPTFAAERRHILAHMAAVFRSWMRQGFSEGQAGHISVLDPEYHHLMWMNPWGRHFGTLTAGDMVLVDMATGNIVGRRTVKGGQPRTHNGAGYLLHSSVHTARPDMHAVCHAHTHNGRAWSVFGRPLDMLTKDVCKFHGELAVYNNNGAIVSGREEGDLIAKALGKNRAGILINHGLLTLGHTVDEAGYMFNMLDRSCGIQLAVEAACAGNPALRKHIMPDAEAAWNHDEAVDKDMLYREAQPDISFEFASAGGEHVLAAGADDIVITTDAAAVATSRNRASLFLIALSGGWGPPSPAARRLTSKVYIHIARTLGSSHASLPFPSAWLLSNAASTSFSVGRSEHGSRGIRRQVTDDGVKACAGYFTSRRWAHGGMQGVRRARVRFQPLELMLGRKEQRGTEALGGREHSPRA